MTQSGSLFRQILVVVLLFTFFTLTVMDSAALLAQQRVPRRLFSTGDSITRAFDAELVGDDFHASWVNGYFGFYEWVFGLHDVNSHNQRISRNFGSSGRANYLAAQNGAKMVNNFPDQAAIAVQYSPDYVTVMFGGNDVCKDAFADIPTDAEFRNAFRRGMDILTGRNPSHPGLPNGATIYVISIPDVYRLWQIGREKNTVLGIDCQALWTLTVLGFPCSTMLSPFVTEAGRQYTRSRNIAFNQILAQESAAYAGSSPNHFIFFTNTVFQFSFLESDISNFDCFHPSWRGQRTISNMTWSDGPFKRFTR